jgi:hypothetical protein
MTLHMCVRVCECVCVRACVRACVRMLTSLVTPSYDVTCSGQPSAAEALGRSLPIRCVKQAAFKTLELLPLEHKATETWYSFHFSLFSLITLKRLTKSHVVQGLLMTRDFAETKGNPK